MTQYDFSPLSLPLTGDDMALVPRRSFISTTVFPMVAAGLLVLSAVFMSFAGFGATGTTLNTVVIAVAVTAFYLVGLTSHKRLARLYKFAMVNGLTFMHDIAPSGLNGMIFDEGHTRKIKELLSFPDGIEIGTFEYVTGGGKNRSTHTFGYIKVALTRHLPNMVLDARSNNLWKFSNLPDTFDRSQRLELEGDFNQHFDLYVPKQYEQDALYVFTPDVMQALIDYGKAYDMEVVNDELYMYKPTSINMSSEKDLRSTLDVIEEVSGELRQQTKRYSDERVANNQLGSIVAVPGQRLKAGFNPIVILIVIIVVTHFLLQFIPLLLDTI